VSRGAEKPSRDDDRETLGAVVADAIARLRAGEAPRAEEYIARHPHLAGEIAADLETIAALEGLGTVAAERPRIDGEAVVARTAERPRTDAEAVDAALSALPENLQRAFFLRHGEGRAWETIAAELGEDEAALRREYASVIHRLLERGPEKGDASPQPHSHSRGGG